MGRTILSKLYILVAAVALVLQCNVTDVHAQGVPTYKVDPAWPKPLPTTTDKDGQVHRWIMGEVGGICVDPKNDHIFLYNRGWEFNSLGKLKIFEAWTGVASPPIIVFDTAGNVVRSWGDATFESPKGPAKVLPEAPHGCYVDYEGNVWLGGAQRRRRSKVGTG